MNSRREPSCAVVLHKNSCFMPMIHEHRVKWLHFFGASARERRENPINIYLFWYSLWTRGRRVKKGIFLHFLFDFNAICVGLGADNFFVGGMILFMYISFSGGRKERDLLPILMPAKTSNNALRVAMELSRSHFFVSPLLSLPPRVSLWKFNKNSFVRFEEKLEEQMRVRDQEKKKLAKL